MEMAKLTRIVVVMKLVPNSIRIVYQPQPEYSVYQDCINDLLFLFIGLTMKTCNKGDEHMCW